jgi:hypothetical protein
VEQLRKLLLQKREEAMGGESIVPYCSGSQSGRQYVEPSVKHFLEYGRGRRGGAVRVVAPRPWRDIFGKDQLGPHGMAGRV